MKTYLLAGAVAVTMLGAAAGARDKAGPQPRIVAALAQCRTIPEDAERLRCFDTAATEFATAVEQKTVVVVDKAEVEQKKREEFGSRRSLGLPDSGVVDAVEVDEVSGVIASAQLLKDGNWSVVLQDGTAWRQTDAQPFGREPRAGDTVSIRKAALGTFKMNVGRQNAVRVRRTR